MLKDRNKIDLAEAIIFETANGEIAALANYALGLENEDIHFGSGVKLFFSHKNIGFVFNVFMFHKLQIYSISLKKAMRFRNFFHNFVL